MKFWNVYRQQCAETDELSAYLLTCSPFKAKKHISNMRDIFNTLNLWLPDDKKVHLTLKLPRKTL